MPLTDPDMYVAYSSFSVTTDEKGDYEVRVCVVLQGLRKKFGRNEPANAKNFVLKTKEQ